MNEQTNERLREASRHGHQYIVAGLNSSTFSGVLTTNQPPLAMFPLVLHDNRNIRAIYCRIIPSVAANTPSCTRCSIRGILKREQDTAAPFISRLWIHSFLLSLFSFFFSLHPPPSLSLFTLIPAYLCPSHLVSSVLFVSFLDWNSDKTMRRGERSHFRF